MIITDHQILVNISIKESVSVFGEHKRRLSKTFILTDSVSKCICSTSIHPSIYTHTHTDVLTVQIIIIICYIYIALFWVLKALYIEGGNLLNHHQCAASTWMMRRQPYCTRTPTTHQLTGGEETSDEANLCMGIVKMFLLNIQMQKHPVVLLLETNPSNMYV